MRLYLVVKKRGNPVCASSFYSKQRCTHDAEALSCGKVKFCGSRNLTFGRDHACPPLMPSISTKQLPFSRAEKLRHLGNNLRMLLIWPLLFGLVAAALWGWAYWMI